MTDLVFLIIFKNWSLEGLFVDLACCHGNRYDVTRALKVLTNNRVAKIFIVCLCNEISFFGIFHRFTNTIATKKPYWASLSPPHTVRKELSKLPHSSSRVRKNGNLKKNDPRFFSWGFMLSFQNTTDSRDLYWKHAFHRHEPIHMAVHCLFLRHPWACRAFGRSHDFPKERFCVRGHILCQIGIVLTSIGCPHKNYNLGQNSLGKCDSLICLCDED